MRTTITAIRTLWQTIRNELNRRANTAERVGAAGIALCDAIDAESQARQNADTALAERIEAEATARMQADAAINQRIGAETTARIQGDANTLAAANAHTNQSIAAIQVPGHYIGMVIESGLPATGQVAGDWYFITNFDVTNNGRQGIAVWNGSQSRWDKHVDMYHKPDGVSIVLRDSDGALMVNPEWLKERVMEIIPDIDLSDFYTRMEIDGLMMNHNHAISQVTGLQSALDNRALTGHTHAWDTITGRPAAFAPAAHNHDASSINSGVFPIARIPTGTAANTVSLGNHAHAWESITGRPTAFAPSAHSHNEILVTDNRGEERLPAAYPVRSLSTFFNMSIPGLSGWHSGIVVRGWNANHNVWQLIGNAAIGGATNKLYFRTAGGEVTSWGRLHTLYHSGDNNIGTGATNYAAGNHTHTPEQVGAASAVPGGGVYL